MNKSEMVNNVIQKIKSMVREEASFAYWEGEQWKYRWQNDNVQGTAFALKAILLDNPDDKLVLKSAKWLMQQKQGYSWRSTQETASVIFALTDYLRFSKELNPDFKAIVFLNDRKVIEKYFTKDDIFRDINSIKISGLKSSDLKHGKNNIKIIKEGEGKLYFSGLNEYYSKNQIAAAKYFLLKPEQRDGRIVYVKEAFRGTVKSGEDILVKTYVSSSDNNLQYFILEDMLPSGFETVKDEQNYEIEGEGNYRYYNPYNYYRPWIRFYADKEYRVKLIS